MLAQLKERKDGHVSVRLFASIYSVVRFFMPHIASTFILNIFIIFLFSKTNILLGINISRNFIY